MESEIVCRNCGQPEGAHVLNTRFVQPSGALVPLDEVMSTGMAELVCPSWARRWYGTFSPLATEGTDVVPNRDDPASSGGTKGNDLD